MYKRQAGYIIEADIVAELDGGRVAAMLAADAQLDVGAGLAAAFGSHLDQLANAVLIQSGEGIVLIDLVLIVGIQELAGVVTAEALSLIHISGAILQASWCWDWCRLLCNMFSFI